MADIGTLDSEGCIFYEEQSGVSQAGRSDSFHECCARTFFRASIAHSSALSPHLGNKLIVP
jgi:hypothetical protein